MAESRAMIEVLKGRPVFPPPIWMMRQAGRYLPEYREVRKRAGSFLDLCYNPDLAVEVTLQPIRRFGFDASILFSDILVVPHALGRDLRFEEGRGPLMTPIGVVDIDRLDASSFHDRLAETHVYSSVFQHVLYRLVLTLYRYRGTVQRITRIHLIPSSFPGRAELRHCRSLSAGELDGFNGQWFNTGPRSE